MAQEMTSEVLKEREKAREAIVITLQRTPLLTKQRGPVAVAEPKLLIAKYISVMRGCVENERGWRPC